MKKNIMRKNVIKKNVMRKNIATNNIIKEKSFFDTEILFLVIGILISIFIVFLINTYLRLNPGSSENHKFKRYISDSPSYANARCSRNAVGSYDPSSNCVPADSNITQSISKTQPQTQPQTQTQTQPQTQPQPQTQTQPQPQPQTQTSTYNAPNSSACPSPCAS